MSVYTTLVWNNDAPTDSEKETISQHLATLIAKGDTTGESAKIDGATTYTVRREWIKTEVANDWITFVTAYNPVSAKIGV